jgi:hypothetical protein
VSRTVRLIDDSDEVTGESACCGAPVSVQGRTTRYYVCSGCGRACDVKAS